MTTVLAAVAAGAAQVVANVDLVPREWRVPIAVAAAFLLVLTTGLKNLYVNPDGTDARTPYESLKLPKL